jgi:hypothetical protein
MPKRRVPATALTGTVRTLTKGSIMRPAVTSPKPALANKFRRSSPHLALNRRWRRSPAKPVNSQAEHHPAHRKLTAK